SSEQTDAGSLHGLVLLQELLDNGSAENHRSGICIPHVEASKLTAAELESLGLPAPYPFGLYLDLRGTPDDDDAEFLLHFEVERSGRYLQIQRTGALLQAGDEDYILAEDQFVLTEAVRAFNCRAAHERVRTDTWVRFAQIKQLAEKAEARLHAYLESEHVVKPQRIGIDVQRADDRMVIRPTISGMDEFPEQFSRFKRGRPTYSVSDDRGARTRVVFDKLQREGLEQLK